MAARRLKPGWWVLGALILGLGLWLGGMPLLRSLDFFRLRRVEFTGLRHLTPEAVLPAVRLPEGASLFDPLDSVEAALDRLAGIRTATVRRRLPGTLRIAVTEREPVALAPGPKGMIMVDDRGRALPFDPAVSAPDLPVTPAPDSLVAGALARVRDVDPALYARVLSARQVKGDVVLELETTRYWLRADPPAEAIRALTAVAADLARQGTRFRELDGRFARQVVVRGRGA